MRHLSLFVIVQRVGVRALHLMYISLKQLSHMSWLKDIQIDCIDEDRGVNESISITITHNRLCLICRAGEIFQLHTCSYPWCFDGGLARYVPVCNNKDRTNAAPPNPAGWVVRAHSSTKRMHVCRDTPTLPLRKQNYNYPFLRFDGKVRYKYQRLCSLVNQILELSLSLNINLKRGLWLWAKTKPQILCLCQDHVSRHPVSCKKLNT